MQIDPTLRQLLLDLLQSEDNEGCSDNLTVVASNPIQQIRTLIEASPSAQTLPFFEIRQDLNLPGNENWYLNAYLKHASEESPRRQTLADEMTYTEAALLKATLEVVAPKLNL